MSKVRLVEMFDCDTYQVVFLILFASSSTLVSEFSISPEALDALSSFVNAHGALYDQGLAFGGINGVAVKHIHGDGYWNQVSFLAIE
jgi:hypothetical protein